MPDLFPFFKGFSMGVILSVTLPSASIWLIHVGFRRNWRQANAAGLGLAAGHTFITLLVGYFLLLALPLWRYLAVPVRSVTVIILIVLAVRCFRARRADSLRGPDEVRMPENGRQILQQTAFVLVTMPMRVPAVFAVMIATAILYRAGGALGLPLLGLGVGTGALSWSCFLAFLGWISAPRVDEPVILKSLNKLHRFAAVVYGVLVMITLYPLLLS